MKTSDLAKLRRQMKRALEPKRYEHTLSVTYTAANLAAVHGVDVEKALVAGMLHDCAKCISHKEQLAICVKNNMQLSELEAEENSPLIHAKAGSILAKDSYGITDEDILNAICYHTTGRPQMSPLEKIIYIADYMEPGRKHIKRTASEPNTDRLTQIRRMAYHDLDEALYNILGDTLNYLQEKGGKVDSMTHETYKYYKQYQNNGIIQYERNIENE